MQNHLPLMRCTTRAAQQIVLSIVGVSQTGYQKTSYKKPLPALEPFRRLEFSRIKDMPLWGKQILNYLDIFMFKLLPSIVSTNPKMCAGSKYGTKHNHLVKF